ncbi:MAG TPA: universal stress protein [Anaeromyxobacteraceae bacterium]|nr:universal stress protein [Anaeromyxobacteraceae bacterium]
MAHWRKVGCAVDFSETSRAAMEEAADLAKGSEAELLLIHAFEIPGAPADMPPPPDSGRATRVELERKLEAWRAEAARRSGGAATAVVVEGAPADEVARCARERGVDLLVVGTHGRRGLRHLVIGSVAERLVRVAHCPVLVVRGRA